MSTPSGLNRSYRYRGPLSAAGLRAAPVAAVSAEQGAARSGACWAAGSEPLRAVPRHTARWPRTFRTCDRLYSPPRTRGSATRRSSRISVGELMHELPDQAARSNRFGRRRRLECRPQAFSAQRRGSLRLPGHEERVARGPQRHQGGMHLSDRRSTCCLGGHHSVDETGQVASTPVRGTRSVPPLRTATAGSCTSQRRTGAVLQ